MKQCQKCEHIEYCVNEDECILGYEIYKVKDSGSRKKKDDKYFKNKRIMNFTYKSGV